MSKPPFKDVFSLWLMAKEDEHRIWEVLISQLARENETARFAPHMTLLGLPDQPSTQPQVNELLIRGERLAQRLLDYPRTTAVEFVGIGSRNSYIQSLFLMGVPTRTLMDWFNEACSIFSKVASPAGIYMPHFSLMYGDLSIEKKLAIVRDLPMRFPCDITFDRLALYNCNGMPDEWHEVATWPISTTNKK